MIEDDIKELQNKIDLLFEHLGLDYEFEKKVLKKKRLGVIRENSKENSIIPEIKEVGGVRESERFE